MDGEADSINLSLRRIAIRRSLIFGIWYCCIAAGFALLGVNRILVGGERWLIALRFVIAIGFALLGYIELKGQH